MTNSASFAADSFFYIASAGNEATPGGIYRGNLNEDTGKLTLLPRVREAEKVFWLEFSPDRKFLYSSLMSKEGAIGAFRVEKDGALTALNTQPSGGAAPCHLGIDAAGRHVLTANYSGGNVAVLRVLPDGSLGEHTGGAQFTGSGPDPKRQQKPYAHGIYFEGDFAYACDLGTDSVMIYRLDPSTGALMAGNPQKATLPPGSGPRHMAFSKDGKIAYVNGEMGMNVVVFSRDAATGALMPIQDISTLPEGASREGATTAEIALHPSGKWLYVNNRGHDSITSYAVAQDGKLTWVENIPAQTQAAFNFVFTPNGRGLLIAGQKDGRIASFSLDPATGKLAFTGNIIEIPSPFCLLFAR